MRLCKLKNKYRNIKNNGATMIVAIIIMAILMIFVFSLMLVTYSLYASQNKKAANLRCSEAANSLSVALEKELTDPNAHSNSRFWKYLRCNILLDETWPYYNPSEAEHTEEYAYRYFDMKTNTNYGAIEGFPGQVTLCMYWTLPKDTVLGAGQRVRELPVDKRNESKLYVEITCETGSQSYTVVNEYLIEIEGLDINNSEDEVLITELDEMKADSRYNPMLLGAQDGQEIKGLDKFEKWNLVFLSRE